jgi:hypothetical protein
MNSGAYRSDSEARIAYLEAELQRQKQIVAEKDALIEQLKCAKDRVPTDKRLVVKRIRERLRYFARKTIRAAAILAGSAIGIASILYLIEPNDVYLTDGYIINMNKLGVVTTITSCDTDVNSDGKVLGLKECREETEVNDFKSADMDYVFEYTDFRKDKHRVKIYGNERDQWFRERKEQLPTKLYAAPQSEDPKVYTGNTIPSVGCRVRVYYLSGRWFKSIYKLKYMSWFRDWSLFDPFIDTSMCKRPGLPAARKSNAPASSDAQKPEKD